jgi:prolyl-tRNA editing enzyme YbaK/EbsC (Cys-tRNA(Pro) deacylase)
MSGGLDRFLEAARALGVDPEIRRFPEGTKTAADAAAAVGCELGQIVKSLVFIADDRPVLALTAGDHRVDVGKLAHVARAREARRADSEEARAATGFAVGGTPPFGHPDRLRAFADPALLRHAVVWSGAGVPDAVFALDPGRLVTLAGAKPADFVENPT